MRKTFLCLLGCAALSGCGQAPAQQQFGPPPKAEVDVCVPKVETVQDYEDFPGRIDSIHSIDVRARVTGYLEKVHFKEGEEVKKGDLLFEIDARPYEAELAKAVGNVLQMEGRLKRLDADYARAGHLLGQRGMSQEEFDKVAGDRAEAVGSVKSAKAQRDLAELNVQYTKVRASISGRISRRAIDPGNLVKADDTVLTSIVALDPVYAYFDLDERSTLKAQRLVREGKIKWNLDATLPVYVGLIDEEGFPRKGLIDFADNHIDPDTGTWRVRARFNNPDRALLPGMFVRMRFHIGEPYKALLVCEQALGTDQGQRFAFVVNSSDKVEYRRVKVGRLHKGLRVVTDGVHDGERVVVNGLQRIRQDAEVAPNLLKEMPVVSDGQLGEKK